MSGGTNQIRQMVNFILQEAHEKANEIRIKTEHDFNIEKQMLVHNAKLAIAEDYKQKDREREVSERIAVLLLVVLGDGELGVVDEHLLLDVEVVLRLDADLVGLLVGLLEDEVHHLPDLVRPARH